MFLFLVNCFIFLANILAVLSASLPQDAVHLLRFRSSLPEPSQQLLPWNQSVSHCQWKGVSCYSDGSSHVESLDFMDFLLSGSLEKSFPNLCHLARLLSLDLSGNHFTGSIPATLANCSLLDTILLNDNRLSGPIPPEIFKPNKLLQLDLGFNQLNGTIPSEVGLSTNLQYLGLYNDSLSGNIPKELFDLPNLTYLYLHINNLTGPLPDFPSTCSLTHLYIHLNHFSGSLPITLGNCHNLTAFYALSANLGGVISPETFRGLSNLKDLSLYDNHFEGEIPETLWNGSLQELVLSTNKFNGSISEKIGGSNQITFIDLTENKLTGQIPRSVGYLKNLSILRLHNNNFNGTLPPELGNCTSLVEISIANNSISGEIPPELCNLQNLTHFYAFTNQIHGHIPGCIGRMRSLEELALYENQLIGEIPPGITNLTKLGFLYLAHNNLTGDVPPELGKNNNPGFVKIDLGWNDFSGPIPPDLCNGDKLTVLILENNRFNGSFPTYLAKCRSLYRVKLLNNHLHGSIPAEIGKLQKLERLTVSSNRLTGQIPLQLSYCAKLAELDLSNNNLSGHIPKEIASASALKKLLIQDNKISGAIPDTFSSMQNLGELQLGNNLLEGPIPCSLSRLLNLDLALNLSMNRFTGSIPKCLSNLDKLEVLDISSNNLSGAIPPEMEKMKSLWFLNISFNDFSGKVPISWEKLLSSTSATALGNPELCLSGNEGSNCQHVKKSQVKWKTLAGIISGCVLSMAIIVAAIYLLVTWIQNPNKHQHVNCQSGIEDLPDGITFEDIESATEGWSEKYIIGRGKHGTVYKMESVKSKKHWAVKKVDLAESAFYDEMRTLNIVRHRNLVRSGGYCIRHGYGFILTEYIPGGTLHDVLHLIKPPTVLDWESRCHIALGIAQGISYLHHDLVPQVIHRDIKSDNIMLDHELEPKVGDFGMAKIASYSDDSIESVIVGTLGYIAPENAYSLRLTEKSDVYSYGVLLLELICRKMPVDPSFEEGLDIVSWVKMNLQRNDSLLCFLDAEIRLWDVEEQCKALKIIDLALQCTQPEANTRPSMKDVIKSLIELNHK